MQRVEVPTFDTIHDAQTVFRKLLDALARPGKIQSIADAVGRILAPAPFSSALLACAFVLLDQEVKFAVVAPATAEIADYLRWQTFSSASIWDAADYLFVDDDLSTAGIGQLMEKVKRGTLIEPHTSATLFITVAELESVPEPGQLVPGTDHDVVVLELTGPGVNGSTTCVVRGLSTAWLEERSLANAEYPLGVDMVLATRRGDLLGLPRTTVVRHTSVLQGV